MSAIHSNNRASLCAFTFSDGRRCRTPRQSGHAQFCCFHARKQAQANAAQQLGRDFAYFLSGDCFSACDLAAALGRLFSAVARGEVKPRTAATLAYLAQTLLQTIRAAQSEYIGTFGTQAWRDLVSVHTKQNEKYVAGDASQPVPPPPSSQPGTPVSSTPSSKPAPSSSQQPGQPSLSALPSPGAAPPVGTSKETVTAKLSEPPPAKSFKINTCKTD